MNYMFQLQSRALQLKLAFKLRLSYIRTNQLCILRKYFLVLSSLYMIIMLLESVQVLFLSYDNIVYYVRLNENYKLKYV